MGKKGEDLADIPGPFQNVGFFQEFFQPLTVIQWRSVVRPADTGNARNASGRDTGISLDYCLSGLMAVPAPTLSLGADTVIDGGYNILSAAAARGVCWNVLWKVQVPEPL